MAKMRGQAAGHSRNGNLMLTFKSYPDGIFITGNKVENLIYEEGFIAAIKECAVFGITEKEEIINGNI